MKKWQFWQKHKKWANWKWLFLLVIPLAAAIVAYLVGRRKAIIPPSRALVQLDQEPQRLEEEISVRQGAAIPVTSDQAASAGMEMDKGPARAYTYPLHGPVNGHALREGAVRPVPILIWLLALVILAAAAMLIANYRPIEPGRMVVAGGDPQRGRTAIAVWGCGACHTIPGITGANGQVGPDLTNFSGRGFIAGSLPNQPDNLVRWIMHPQQVSPGNGMPEMGVPDATARDMAAYLYTLR